MKIDKEIIAEIKNALQYPTTLLEMMNTEGFNRNDVSDYMIDDCLKAIRKVVKLLNKLAGWKKVNFKKGKKL